MASATNKSKLQVCESERLYLRQFTDADANFIVEILNDPDFIRYVTDRNVRSVDDALSYLANGPYASFAEHGHALNLVVEKKSAQAIGMCGMLKRPTMEFPDIGYSFLPAFRGQGYAREAAQATIAHASEVLGMRVITAVVNPINLRSIHLLQSIGFRSIGDLVFHEDEPPAAGYRYDVPTIG